MPFWVHLLLTIVMGIGMAGVGMNVCMMEIMVRILIKLDQ
jgi:hypothetical protein